MDLAISSCTQGVLQEREACELHVVAFAFFIRSRRKPPAFRAEIQGVLAILSSRMNPAELLTGSAE